MMMLQIEKLSMKNNNLRQNIKAAATDMRYLTRSKFFRSLVHKRFLAWYENSFPEYLFCPGRWDNSFEFE